MKTTIITLAILFGASTYSNAQEEQMVLIENNVKAFPNGTYLTFDDFDNGNISETPILTLKTTDDIAYRFITPENKKYKKHNVVVHEGIPYFSIIGIIKNFEKDSKGQAFDGGNYYLKAESVNGNLLFRDYFTSNTAGILGGLTGTLAARRQKILLYNPESNNFKLFKNFNSVEEFVTKHFPEKIEYINLAKNNPNLKDEADKIDYVLKNVL